MSRVTKPERDPTVERESLSWLLDEVAYAGEWHLDPDYVAEYDEKSPTDWSEDVETLLSLGVGATSTVVDLGAGTGAFARAIAPHVARVVGVDVSEPMVAAMHERGVEAVRAGFLTYHHEGQAPDAVFTRNALHHLPDFWKVIALKRSPHERGPIPHLRRRRELAPTQGQVRERVSDALRRFRRGLSAAPQHPGQTDSGSDEDHAYNRRKETYPPATGEPSRAPIRRAHAHAYQTQSRPPTFRVAEGRADERRESSAPLTPPSRFPDGA
jgi:SAM-dependent methyltransferase